MLNEAMFSNLRNIFVIFLWAMTIACTVEPQQKAQTNMREYIHPNGLAVKLSNDFAAKEFENGFIVEPSDGSNKNVRMPVEIKISLLKNKQLPKDNSLQSKDFGNRKINYKITKDDGGSGGETYSFVGFENVSDGYVEYSQNLQSKYSEPDFQKVWEIIENTSLKSK
jgi:hypothetical protein